MFKIQSKLDYSQNTCKTLIIKFCSNLSFDTKQILTRNRIGVKINVFQYFNRTDFYLSIY